MKTPEEIQALASKFCNEKKCYSYGDYCGYRCLIHKFAKSISRVMSDEEILESARKYIKSMSDFYEYTPMMRFAHSLCAYGEKLNNLQRTRGVAGHGYYVLPEESYDEALLKAVVELVKMDDRDFYRLRPKILASPEAFKRIGSNEILGVPVKISYLIPYIRVYFGD